MAPTPTEKQQVKAMYLKENEQLLGRPASPSTLAWMKYRIELLHGINDAPNSSRSESSPTIAQKLDDNLSTFSIRSQHDITSRLGDVSDLARPFSPGNYFYQPSSSVVPTRNCSPLSFHDSSSERQAATSTVGSNGRFATHSDSDSTGLTATRLAASSLMLGVPAGAPQSGAVALTALYRHRFHLHETQLNHGKLHNRDLPATQRIASTTCALDTDIKQISRLVESHRDHPLQNLLETLKSLGGDLSELTRKGELATANDSWVEAPESERSHRQSSPFQIYPSMVEDVRRARAAMLAADERRGRSATHKAGTVAGSPVLTINYTATDPMIRPLRAALQHLGSESDVFVMGQVWLSDFLHSRTPIQIHHATERAQELIKRIACIIAASAPLLEDGIFDEQVKTFRPGNVTLADVRAFISSQSSIIGRINDMISDVFFKIPFGNQSRSMLQQLLQTLRQNMDVVRNESTIYKQEITNRNAMLAGQIGTKPTDSRSSNYNPSEYESDHGRGQGATGTPIDANWGTVESRSSDANLSEYESDHGRGLGATGTSIDANWGPTYSRSGDANLSEDESDHGRGPDATDTTIDANWDKFSFGFLEENDSLYWVSETEDKEPVARKQKLNKGKEPVR